MERGEPCECGYHVLQLPVGTYICPARQRCPKSPGCEHAVYHEPDDGCDWKVYVCMGVGHVNCVNYEQYERVSNDHDESVGEMIRE
jgi:hypothetical protein